MMDRLCLLIVGCLCVVFAGCTTVPPRDVPLDHIAKDQGYRYTGVTQGENSDSLLVILTFSGGGTRAAALSYGVLEKLAGTTIEWEGKQRCLLDEVDLISSVSGGSFTAAYFGLYGHEMFNSFDKKVLYRNFQAAMIKQALTLRNLSRLNSATFNRTGLMAEYLDQNVFDHQTFGDLTARSTRPFIVINATNMSIGSRFEFTQDQFDLLYSDLSVLPVAYGVAASAAFPGLLSPLTLRNFPKQPDFSMPEWVGEALKSRAANPLRYDHAGEVSTYGETDRAYVHLIDGGVSDNLGLQGVLDALESTDSPWTFAPGIKAGKVKKVVVITVNAKPRKRNIWDAKETAPKLGLVLATSGTTPMTHFTSGMIEYFKLKINQWTEEQRFREKLDAILTSQNVTLGTPLPETPKVDYYFVEVAFDWLKDADERDYFNELPTTLTLPEAAVNRLRYAAETIMDGDAVYAKLMTDLKATYTPLPKPEISPEPPKPEAGPRKRK